MQTVDIASLSMQVLGASFVLFFLFGWLAHRTHFCTMGAVSDVVNMGDWSRMRQWIMAMGVGMVGFGVLSSLGLVNPNQTIYAGDRWLWASAALGGALFGVGMVLASGCGSKTLIRVGGGNLKSVVVFVVLGVSAYATMRGVTAVLRVNTVDQLHTVVQGGASLPALATTWGGLTAPKASLLVGCGVGVVLIAFALLGRGFLRAENLLAGGGIGAILTAMWYVSGHLGFVPEHPETLEAVYLATNSGRAESMTFVAPIAYTLDWVMLFSDKSKVLTLGIVGVLGVVAGSCASAVLQGSFRWEGFASTEDLANHLVGAVLMGVGGVTAMGCTVGQGLSGISTLSLTSFVAVAFIVLGAWLALRYQTWRLERSL